MHGPRRPEPRALQRWPGCSQGPRGWERARCTRCTSRACRAGRRWRALAGAATSRWRRPARGTGQPSPSCAGRARMGCGTPSVVTTRPPWAP
eukprot:8337696-Lingulodinium_polyedra.AAC.1